MLIDQKYFDQKHPKSLPSNQTKRVAFRCHQTILVRHQNVKQKEQQQQQINYFDRISNYASGHKY